jgi:hypothetical protein
MRRINHKCDRGSMGDFSGDNLFSSRRHHPRTQSSGRSRQSDFLEAMIGDAIGGAKQELELLDWERSAEQEALV